MGLRQDRLADEIRDIVAGLFTGGTLNDPRIRGVTITAAKVSPDLQVAIYTTVYIAKTSKLKMYQRAWKQAVASFMRKKIGSALELRRVPDLRFSLMRALIKHPILNV